jgi:hypothetical protein
MILFVSERDPARAGRASETTTGSKPFIFQNKIHAFIYGRKKLRGFIYVNLFILLARHK